MAIKNLANEFQEVNIHVHSIVFTYKKLPTGEIASFVWMVHGYYMATRISWLLYGYQNIWTATSGERLTCAHKKGDRFDSIYLLLLFTLAFTLTLTAQIMDG